ncbi:MAG: S-adenosylmethionine decarboxylase [Bacillota bacterium]
MPPIGWSFWADAYNCKVCPDENKVVFDWAIQAVKEAGLHPVGVVAHDFPVEKHPGLSGASIIELVIKLEESHFAVHTWPEYGLVCVDIFTCGDYASAEKAMDKFLANFQPGHVERGGDPRGNLLQAALWAVTK